MAIRSLTLNLGVYVSSSRTSKKSIKKQHSVRARCDTNDVVYNVIFIEIYKPIIRTYVYTDFQLINGFNSRMPFFSLLKLYVPDIFYTYASNSIVITDNYFQRKQHRMDSQCITPKQALKHIGFDIKKKSGLSFQYVYCRNLTD